MRLPQSLFGFSRAYTLSFVLTLPLSQCAVPALALSASLPPLRVTCVRVRAHLCECVLCVCVLCVCACAVPAVLHVCVCVCVSVRACRFRWLLFELFFFRFRFCSVSSASPRCQTRKRTLKNARANTIFGVFFIIIIYLFSVVQFKCRLHRRVYQFRHLLWNGK